MKLPVNQNWTQANKSDLFGSLAWSKNINLDERGYIKLSPRSVLLLSEVNDSAHGLPVAMSAFNTGNNDATNALIMTSDAPYEFDPSTIGINYDEDTGTSNPTGTLDSHAIWWLNRWHASTDTTIVSRTAASNTWTSRVTGLTSGVRHTMCVHKGRNTLCIANGNVVKQTATGAYTAGIDLTLATEYEVTNIVYNNERIGIICKQSSNTSTGITDDSYFFVWDGATVNFNQGVAIGAPGALALLPYKGSFLIVTEAGQLKYWTGGGFQDLGNLPFYTNTTKITANVNTYGDVIKGDGDVVYLNIGNEVKIPTKKKELTLQDFPAGVWCYDPDVGFYHRYSPSISQAYVVTVNANGVDVSTNILTAASGTIPATGNVARYTNNSGTNITGLTLFTDYYIIKIDATTFKLATTKENALAGVAVDLTAQGGASYFWMYNLVDYGQSYYSKSGAIGLFPFSTPINESIMMGANLAHTTLTEYSDACMTVPNLENRGYFVISKVLTQGVQDNAQKIFIKYKPLDTNDAVIVKYKPRDVLGLPTTSPQETYNPDEATWAGAREFSTKSDISEAKTYLDAGGEIEMEITAGAGAGQMIKVSSISAPSSGTYSVELAEDVIGMVAGSKSYFILDNWHTLSSVTASTQQNDGILEVAIGDSHKWSFFKVELRGYNTTVEVVEPVFAVHKQAK